ncbi:hypothetical protein BBJ28_00008221 [Nothophytophthora sp. Chile5]|nr:hypothetical protein BBJ28_00008221 [Nothophytophthora sp. Chile5]
MVDKASPALRPAASATRTIELLAPLYADVCDTVTGAATAFPVAFQRTATDWIQLVFTGRNLVKDVACVNSASGCRCDYVRFLRALMVLMERHILQVDTTYVVAPRAIGQPRVATLQMRVRVHDSAKRGTLLKEFDFVLCHLQASVLSIVARNQQARKNAVAAALADAKNSACHVVGCRLHPWDHLAKLSSQPKKKLNLPDVFHSLTTQMEVEQMEIRDDVTYLARMTRPNKQVVVTDLPTNVLQDIVCLMNARDLASLSGVCSLFQHMAYEVVPGLNLVLYEHQRRGLKWMLHRETPSLAGTPLPHPFILSGGSAVDSELALDLIEHKVITQSHAVARDACGGMFCDEPGLGKTITMLALILRTKGQTTDNTPVEAHRSGAETARAGLRSSGACGRTVRVEDLVSSGASLIVVPDPLVEHWKYQVEAHVAPGALRVFVDPGVDYTLPCNMDLAEYDVVITSFSRLAREWKRHRPTSALEERMPDRYGFDGPQRYADGTIRGEVSSLLTVHWVRVIVDEGHKLGGQTPSDLMQMARLLCAERRWVMTGTPTPNTLQSADLRYMHGLLVFLRNLPYGNPDGQAWVKAIARPFERNEVVGFYRLQHLLSRIMMRHTKESIREILPDPIRRTVFIDPTPSEYTQYNGVAAAVRANLVITNMDPKKPGSLHPDSLLNPINRKDALSVVSNLRSACCGGVAAVKVVLAESSRLETINMLNTLNVEGDTMASVIDYLHRVKIPGMTTECGSCRRKLQMLMIIPCGHLCCADCVEDRMQKVGPSCFLCNAVYDREAFQELQPGFEFELVQDAAADANDANPNPNGRRGGRANQIQRLINQELRDQGGQRAGRGRGRNQRVQETDGPNGPRQPRRAMDLTRDIHFIDASKAFYAATRIKELKEEFAHRVANPNSIPSRRQARYLKAIIFSQFKEHIWHTKVAFAQQGVPTADFIAGISPDARMKQLMRFRKDPNVNVLLLTEVGSHGLDLSFVTHIFLMDEIWDKSLEQQVISRAHRMGASQAVVVEQLWMRGSVESQMLKPHETEQQQQAEQNEMKPQVPTTSTRVPSHELGSPGRSPKKPNTGGGKMFNSPTRKRKRHRSAPGDARKPSKGNKGSFLQRKLDYVLNNLRLLEENLVAEAGQVRFFVVDEHEEVIRQAIHVMPNRGAHGFTFSTAPGHPPALGSGDMRPPPQSTARPTVNRTVTFATEASSTPASSTLKPRRPDPVGIIVIDSSSSDDGDGDDSDSEDDIMATRLARNAQRRWAKRRTSLAALMSSEDEDEKHAPASVTVKAKLNVEVSAGAKVEVKAEVTVNSKAKAKAKAVSFVATDSDETESE